jgi:hypothetical protein
VRPEGSAAAWGSLVAGLASIATLPVAVYLTRFSERYDLLHAGFAIPVGGLLGLLSIGLARRASRRRALSLGPGGGLDVARIGRVVGIVGICLALAGVVALAVFGLLEYAGARE